MNRLIEQTDLNLTYQHVINIWVKVDVYDKDMVYIDTIDCALISGSFSMDASSDVRRTASFVLYPIYKNLNFLIREDSLVWINRNVVLSVGIQNHKTQEYTFYKLGTFVIMTYNSTYDATTNQLTLNCSDFMAKLDGTKNGELWSLVTSFPAYKEFYETKSTGGTDSYYFEDVSYYGRIYGVESSDHTSYVEGDYVVLKIPVVNFGNDKFRLNSLSSIPILDLETGTNVKAGVMKAGNNYAFRINKNSVSLTSHIPIEKVVDGVPIAYYIIRDAMITAVTTLGGIKEYNIDDIGEFSGMPQYNPDYLQYRKENPLWNNIPYDLEFNVGDNVLSIVTSLRDLYPNYETYFDEDGVFCCNMIPSQIADDPYLSNDYLQEILISENYDIDTSTVRNVCEVWGASLEVDFTASSCVKSGDTYIIDIDEYGDTIFAGDRIAITLDAPNTANNKVVIHTTYTEHDGESTVTKEKTFDPLEIYDEMTDAPLASGVLEMGTIYVFKVKTKLVNGDTPVKYLYYQSEYQPQAIDVLTDGTASNEIWNCADGTTTHVFTKKYFADKYNCKEKNINFTIDETSPLTIQKLGETLSVKQGGEFENILSDQRALARAIYENWKAARIIDRVNIVTKLCLFADVNKKVEFKRHDSDEIEQYIITSVSHDFSGGTTALALSHFYPLYVDAQ